MDKVYTVDEVAKILKVTRKTVYSYINNGYLKATKISPRKWRITENAIKEMIGELPTE